MPYVERWTREAAWFPVRRSATLASDPGDPEAGEIDLHGVEGLGPNRLGASGPGREDEEPVVVDYEGS